MTDRTTETRKPDGICVVSGPTSGAMTATKTVINPKEGRSACLGFGPDAPLLGCVLDGDDQFGCRWAERHPEIRAKEDCRYWAKTPLDRHTGAD
jgi:hypothetical protein